MKSVTRVEEYKCTVTSEDRRMYYRGRWYWVLVSSVWNDNGSVTRLSSTSVGYGDNNRKWYYAEYNSTPNFTPRTSYRYTITVS